MSLDFSRRYHHPTGSEVTLITDSMRDGPCYPSPVQLVDTPSPEVFDQECDNDDEVSECNLSDDQIEALFSSTRNTNPDISTNISTPSRSTSTFTNWTESSYEISSSEYSFITSSGSERLQSAEFEDHHGSASLNSAPGLQAYDSSADFATPLPYIPPLNLDEAHGSMYLNPLFLADDYFTAMQQLEPANKCVDPALTVHAISDSEASAHAQQDPNAPAKKPFKCPEPGCPFYSARKHNLKTHIATHDKVASKRFECSFCGRRLSRKHDLRRHCETIHGIRMSSSSSSSSSARRLSGRFDMRQPNLPQVQCCTTAVSGDERLISSPHTGSFPDTGLEDLTARWRHGTWLQGESI